MNKKALSIILLVVLSLTMSACTSKADRQVNKAYCRENGGMYFAGFCAIREGHVFSIGKMSTETAEAIEENAAAPVKPVADEAPAAEAPAAVTVDEEPLAHLKYWTTATEADRWPEMDQFDIVACHNDPDDSGNAKITLIVGENLKEDDLVLTYFNGYSGSWSDAVKAQIIEEVQDSVRPHVPGFTLNEVEIIHK